VQLDFQLYCLTLKMPLFAHRKPTLKTTNQMENIHKNAPRRLIKAVIRAGSERKFALKCGINQSYVSQLLHRGIEPGNPDIRAKLFLPRRKRKHREEKPEEWQGQKRVVKLIRRLHRDTTKTFKKAFADSDRR